MAIPIAFGHGRRTPTVRTYRRPRSESRTVAAWRSLVNLLQAATQRGQGQHSRRHFAAYRRDGSLICKETGPWKFKSSPRHQGINDITSRLPFSFYFVAHDSPWLHREIAGK